MTNLLTLHALVVFIQIIPLAAVFDLSRRFLAELEGWIRSIFMYDIAVVFLSFLFSILSFSFLLLPDIADWAFVGLAQVISEVFLVLYLCAAVATCLAIGIRKDDHSHSYLRVVRPTPGANEEVNPLLDDETRLHPSAQNDHTGRLNEWLLCSCLWISNSLYNCSELYSPHNLCY